MNKNEYTGFEIAVIGISCRFPGARNKEEYWNNLVNGKDSITFLTDDQLREAGISEEMIKDPNYVGAAGVLEDHLFFDSEFFNYTPPESEVMDPQVRLFHESVWSAVEDAGYNPDTYKGRIGIYGGASPHLHWQLYSLFTGKNAVIGDSQAKYLNNKDFLAGQISYNFNFKGPAFTLYSACSTSLVAIHQACQSLINGESEMAVAGGVTILNLNKQGYLYHEGMHESIDGRCHTFDKDATGTVTGDGVGVVVLKRLNDAIKDRDNIYAIVKGSAINNDGKNKVGFTAPSIEGQTRVIRNAIKMANISSEDISYVEAHGTATKIGDPIEVEALKRVFNTKKRNYCGLGSVKSNIGHCDCAAGVAGFIKTTLALNHRVLPPTINFKEPNPSIDFKNSPFYVNDKLHTWEQINDKPLYAGVSAFGIGGTNAHAILSQAPEKVNSKDIENSQFIKLSARSKTALTNLAQNLKLFLEKNNDTNLSDLAFTLNSGRKDYEHRRAIIGKDVNELIEKLDITSLENSGETIVNNKVNKNVIFVFSGQGSQFINISKEIYNDEPLFRNDVDACCEIINEILGIKFQDILFPEIENEESKELISSILYSGPAKFIIEYSISKLLISWGISPKAMIGHSFGEFAVACLAGVFSLEDALKIIVIRAQLMEQTAPGFMVSVPLSKEELKPYLNDKLSLAAVNSECLSIVSGELSELTNFENRISELGCEFLRINFPRASHSDLMTPISDDFESAFRKIKLNSPLIPYISGLTGTWIKDDEATNPKYWANHLTNTIQFSKGINELLKLENSIFIQVGSDKGLPLIIDQHITDKSKSQVLNLLKHPKDKISDYNYFLTQLGKIWEAGVLINWNKYYFNQKRRRISLPTYPFDKIEYPFNVNGIDAKAFIGSKSTSDLEDWFYNPSWNISDKLFSKNENRNKWLVFNDKHGIGDKLINKLRTDKIDVIKINSGENFEKISDSEYIINLDNLEDYISIFNKEGNSTESIGIIHLFSLEQNKIQNNSLELLDPRLNESYHSLIKIAQAIGQTGLTGEIQLNVITNNIHDIIGNDILLPEKSTVLGPVKVIPIEYPNISCRSIDIDLQKSVNEIDIQKILSEVQSEIDEKIIAFRNNKRWKQIFEPIQLKKNENGSIPSIKDEGVYIITGGLGGIGFVLSEFLLNEYNANLILTGSSNVKVENTLNDANHNAEGNDKIAVKANRLLKLKELKGNVQYSCLNVANELAMQDLIESATKKYGKINGIFHLAGSPDGKMIQLRGIEDDNSVFNSKIKGTIILEKLIKDINLDFLVYASSRNAIIPSLAHVGHSSANVFMDSYAHLMNNNQPNKLRLSINWNAWKEIGQAKEAKQKLNKNINTNSGFKKKVQHALIDTHLKYDDLDVFTSIFTTERWLVNEHKIGGFYSLPGTAYLELVRMAFSLLKKSASISLEDVYFVQPFIINESEEKEIRIILKKLGDQYQFSVVSKILKSKDKWSEHAVGKVFSVDSQELKAIDINSMLELLEKNRSQNVVEQKIPQIKNIKEFGERWNCIKNVYSSQNEVIKEMELPTKYEQDLLDYELHPSMLDCAVGYSVGDGFYLPFSYQNLIIYKPLKKKVISQVKLENNSSNNNLLSSNIYIYDYDGNLLVQVNNYSRIKIETQKISTDKEKINQPTSGSPMVKEMDFIEQSFVQKIGIETQDNESLSNSEGLEVFKRILGIHGVLSQIIVSKKDIALALKESYEKKIDNVEQNESYTAKKLKLQRQNLSADYVEPTKEVELKIALIFEDFLGYESIGLNDSFFELGGDSLKGIYLINKLFKEFEVKIPVTEFFKDPTIHGLSLIIEASTNLNLCSEDDNADFEELTI